MTIRGSCLCGGIKFEITGPLSGPLNCHCSQCRKQHGAPFRSRVRVEVKDFRWLQGEHRFEQRPQVQGNVRRFELCDGKRVRLLSAMNFLHAVAFEWRFPS